MKCLWYLEKDIPTNEEETKIPLFVIIFGSLDILIWINVKVEHKSFLPKNSNNSSRIFRFPKSKKRIHSTHTVLGTPKEA